MLGASWVKENTQSFFIFPHYILSCFSVEDAMVELIGICVIMLSVLSFIFFHSLTGAIYPFVILVIIILMLGSAKPKNLKSPNSPPK